MYTLFYSPGSMSLATHILLRELDVDFDLQKFATAEGANKTAAYLEVNPTGMLPALRLPDGQVLTENIALLSHLAQTHASSTWPDDRLAQARVLERMSFIASAAHPPFTLAFKPGRWGFDDDMLARIQDAGAKRFLKMLQHLEAVHVGPYAMGAFTVVDPQLLVVVLWAKKIGLKFDTLPKLGAFALAMLQRDAVQEALKAEGLWELVTTMAQRAHR